MKRITLTALVLACVCGACSSSKTTTSNTNTANNTNNASFATAQQNSTTPLNKNNENNPLATMDDATREWFNASLPGSEHAELFGHMLGEWATTMSWRMSPDSDPDVSTGTATNAPHMQRFVKQDFSGEMIPGLPFQGFALFGFNTTTGQYESVWCDNSTTAITTTCGSKQDDGSILWTGSFVDPTNGEEHTSKATLAFAGLNAMTYTVWDRSPEGIEFPSLQVDYTRVQTTANTPGTTNTRSVAGVNEGK